MGRVNDDYYQSLTQMFWYLHYCQAMMLLQFGLSIGHMMGILKKYNKVLRRKKFHFSEETVCTLINAIMDCGEYIIPTPTGKSLPDRKDLPFYEVVMEKQDNHAHL